MVIEAELALYIVPAVDGAVPLQGGIPLGLEVPGRADQPPGVEDQLGAKAAVPGVVRLKPQGAVIRPGHIPVGVHPPVGLSAVAVGKLDGVAVLAVLLFDHQLGVGALVQRDAGAENGDTAV